MLHFFKTKKASELTDWRGPYKHFSKKEMACRCGCGLLPKHELMVRLVRLRKLCGFALPVTSGARCESHNASLGGGPAHPLGVAADIRVSGRKALKLLLFALLLGFTGVGVKQHGEHGRRFIHLDILWKHDSAFRPTLWSYG